MNSKQRVRLRFRTAVFERDGYRCVMCGHPGKDRQGGEGHKGFHKKTACDELVPLDAHHITDRHAMPNGGYLPENGITLCDDGCHRLAEAFHQTDEAVPGYGPDDLYRRIGSSADLAHRASEALGSV